MPTLIACLSTGKGTWSEVARLIACHPWDKIFLITNEFAQKNTSLKQKNLCLIPIDTFKETDEIAQQIKAQLEGKIKDFEIALNFLSGSGKEHMALLKAVMDLGLNFRLTAIKNNQLTTL